MSTGDGTLELRALSRAWGYAGEPPEAAAVVPGHARVTVCDFGPGLDPASRRVNIARRDPFYFRAAEMSPEVRFAADHGRLVDAMLHLFALAHLLRIRKRLAIDHGIDRVVLSSARVTHGPNANESMAIAMVADDHGAEAVQRLKLQFIAGNAAALLASSGNLLAPLVSLARRSNR